jgi:tetratricopeptide (TPR) repeat protein
MCNPKIQRGLVVLSLVVVGFLAYSNTLKVPFHFDDAANIRENPHIRVTSLNVKNLVRVGTESLSRNRPIANISFALNYYFHRYDVQGYHIVNIVIHVLTGVFLFFLTRATLALSSDSLRIPHFGTAFFAALLWLVHPVQTQAVTYVVQRMTSMAAMFYVLSLLFYVKGRRGGGQKSWPWFVGCVLAGIMAQGTKEISATLPFLILLYEWYFFQDLSKAWLKRSLPYFVGTLILLGFFAVLYLGTSPFDAILAGYGHRDFTLSQRVMTEFRVVFYYIGLLFFPHPSKLNLDYDFVLSRFLTEPITTLFCLGGILGLLGLAIHIARKERLISFCILWFLGNLALESSVIGLEVVYEHRVYLPSMLFFVLIVALVYRYVQRRGIIVGCLCGVALVFCFWTYERNSVWRDPVTLWADCVKKSPQKGRVHNNLGLALYEQGRLDQAINEYFEALRLNPTYPQAHNNLGTALAAKGDPHRAIQHYALALQNRPSDAEVYNNWGAALHQQGKLGEAMAHYSEALRIDPNSAEAHNNLGLVFAQQQRFEDAVTQFSMAVRIMPTHVEAHNNLGAALHRQGKVNEAIEYYQEVLRIEPGHEGAHRNLGIALKGVGHQGVSNPRGR